MKNRELNGEAVLGLMRALQDPEISEAVKEIEGDSPLETAINLIQGLESEDAAFRRIKAYYLTEMARRRADQQDLGIKHFTEDQLALLGGVPLGQALLTRMRDGDEAAVPQARVHVKEMEREREDLGL